MYYTNQLSILKIAIDLGCKTAKDLAEFIREYDTKLLIKEQGAAWA